MMSESHYTLKLDVSGVGLGATLLQVQDNMDCGYEEVQDNTML